MEIKSIVKILSTGEEGSDSGAVAAEGEDRSEVNISVLPSVPCLYSNPSASESLLWGIKVRTAFAEVFYLL